MLKNDDKEEELEKIFNQIKNNADEAKHLIGTNSVVNILLEIEDLLQRAFKLCKKRY